MGRRRLRYELRAKGVDSSIIEDALEDAFNARGESEAAIELATRRMRQYGDLPIARVKQRLYSFLLRRGFSSETISEVMGKVFKPTN